MFGQSASGSSFSAASISAVETGDLYVLIFVIACVALFAMGYKSGITR
jgi:hypothetical protein